MPNLNTRTSTIPFSRLRNSPCSGFIRGRYFLSLLFPWLAADLIPASRANGRRTSRQTKGGTSRQTKRKNVPANQRQCRHQEKGKKTLEGCQYLHRKQNGRAVGVEGPPVSMFMWWVTKWGRSLSFTRRRRRSLWNAYRRSGPTVVHLPRR